MIIFRLKDTHEYNIKHRQPAMLVIVLCFIRNMLERIYRHIEDLVNMA